MSIFNRIYTRLQWGALFLAGFGDRSGLYPLRELWTHHTVMTHLSPDATVAQEMAEMRRIERVGQDRFGRGISYNFVIFPSGRIYMGLGASRIGAHTGGRNSIALSVAFAGNYETNRPTAAALSTYSDLIRDFHTAGILAAPRTNGGHQDAPGHAGTTACSGRYMQASLPAVNAAAARPAATTTTPAPKPAPSKPAPSTPVNPAPIKEGPVMSAEEYAEKTWRYTGRDFVNENPQFKDTQLARTYQYTQQTRAEVRELKAMVKALAAAQDEGTGKILEAVEKAERDVIKANAKDVAAELQITTKED